MKVYGPDGRAWVVRRRPAGSGALAQLSPSGKWLVEATTDDERRVWSAAGRRAAAGLVTDVALALRTGAEGPAGELDPRQPDAGSEPGASADD